MLFIEHPVFPLNSSWTSSTHFKAISIVGIFGVELEVLDPEMNDDGCIVHDVVMKVLQVLLLVA